eukprot:2200250-Pyramimonas_sp.AAC.1
MKRSRMRRRGGGGTDKGGGLAGSRYACELSRRGLRGRSAGAPLLSGSLVPLPPSAPLRPVSRA